MFCLYHPVPFRGHHLFLKEISIVPEGSRWDHWEIGFEIGDCLCYLDPAFGLQNSRQVI